ncbi:PLP-dependent aminotransferase family protein [Streptomyces sp. ME19-01-6]|uniref:aminotransferase-like domain-containing protein n=1 Tax=Streptomyces sp. ME19-01-6 TaxID=3028686 RepID=UPI0029A2030B|nr:PLP-dependent aminotransferase family protein [Streptomyces sp. ME19-01-6]MDX3228147.1 PLP-dependent aminotransferase family protein [Streptomyces sp. ME19-01-6]
MTDSGARATDTRATDVHDVRLSQLHGSLADPAMASMNFLNEVAIRFPNAISFAAGRPSEEFLDFAEVHRYVDVFCDHLRRERGMTETEAKRTVLQYGRTKGIIHELVARHLEVDEGISVSSDSLVITVGCQEAMFLVLRALRTGPQDIVLAISPTYVGLTGAARLVDLPVRPVRGGDRGIDFDDLGAQIAEARASGLRPRALYIVPDVANPTGISVDLEARRELLRVAEAEDLLLLEDNAYGVFAGADRLPSLKALDTGRRVVRLGSFAKTVLPGARVGYAVADQRVVDENGGTSLLADHLSTIKSMLTVNTSPWAQAVVGGALVEHGYSLPAANRREIDVYQRNLRLILEGLARRFPKDTARGPQARGPEARQPEVSWNTPAGGFFLTLTVPFRADDELLEYSAKEHGVLWTPMSHFYGGDGGHEQIRLSLSQLTPETIEVGLDRLASLVRERARRR